MTALTRISFGAPGIYHYPETTPSLLREERMDVCAFVGVAPRGPCREPEIPDAWSGEYAVVANENKRRRSVAVAVESMGEYFRLYNGYEGPGRLPYAVAAFFEQGGRKAYIVRIVHEYGDEENLAAVAWAELANATISAGKFALVARNEGSWGNELTAAMGYALRSIQLLPDSTTFEIRLVQDETINEGELLRFTLPATQTEPAIRQLRYVSAIRSKGLDDSGERILLVTLNASLDREPVSAEVVTGEMLVRDGAGQLETFTRLGLSSTHPRWLATVLSNESRLVYPHESWINADIQPPDADFISASPSLDRESAATFSGGEDRYRDIAFDDFFDDGWTLGDEKPGDGIQCLSQLADLSTVVIPDLYVPSPLPETTEPELPGSLSSARFTSCVDIQPEAVDAKSELPELEGLYLDPTLPDDLKHIIQLQKKAVAFTDALKNFVLLLDVPSGLNQAGILRWRSNFNTSYAAAYYPWLKVSNADDKRDRLILVNPSALAAGIIANREIRFGVPHGPANEIAAQVVNVDEAISQQRHDELHQNNINIFLQQRDGIWLSAARTLCREKYYRQLSVRRLIMMLKRALYRQMQWTVFEVNSPSLWSDVQYMLSNYLGKLYELGAFTGNSEDEAFFVRCDAELNTQREIDTGKMIAEIGVAPVEPLEFILLRLTRGGDGTLTVED